MNATVLDRNVEGAVKQSKLGSRPDYARDLMETLCKCGKALMWADRVDVKAERLPECGRPGCGGRAPVRVNWESMCDGEAHLIRIGIEMRGRIDGLQSCTASAYTATKRLGLRCETTLSREENAFVFQAYKADE